jgi:hypothetical protein
MSSQTSRPRLTSADPHKLSEPLGTRVGPYEIVEAIGAGGMGVAPPGLSSPTSAWRAGGLAFREPIQHHDELAFHPLAPFHYLAPLSITGSRRMPPRQAHHPINN